MSQSSREQSRTEYSSEGYSPNEQENSGCDEAVCERVRELLQRIRSSSELDPWWLHEFAKILEDEEPKSIWSLTNSGVEFRSNPTIDEIKTIVLREEGFLELIGSTVLFESDYSVALRAAAVRLRLALVPAIGLQVDVDDRLFSKLQQWIKSGSGDLRCSTEEHYHSEILRIYSIGLLAVTLSGENKNHFQDEVIRSEMVPSFVRYLQSFTLRVESVSIPEEKVVGDKSESENVEKEASTSGDDERKEEETKEIHADEKKQTEKDELNSLEGAKRWYIETATCWPDYVGDADISKIAAAASRAAENEARNGGFGVGAMNLAAISARETVKNAALEALETSRSKEVILAAAWEAADSIANAAESLSFLQARMGIEMEVEKPAPSAETNQINSSLPKFVEWGVSSDLLDVVEERFTIQCLSNLGEYLEVLGPVLQCRGVEICFQLLKRKENLITLPESLKLVSSLAAHRQFASQFVEGGGVQSLLDLPDKQRLYHGISMCLFALSSIQGVMEKLLSLPAPLLEGVIKLAMKLLICEVRCAQKHAALFFGSAFSYPLVVWEFELRQGESTVLNLLQGFLVRPQDFLKQVVDPLCLCLRQYLRSQLLLHLEAVRTGKVSPEDSWVFTSEVVGRQTQELKFDRSKGCKPVDNSSDGVENVIWQIHNDVNLYHLVAKCHWTVAEKFKRKRGIRMMVELIRLAARHKFIDEFGTYALGCLHVLTIVPYNHNTILESKLSRRTGMAILLDATHECNTSDYEVISSALLTICNLTCPPGTVLIKPRQNIRPQLSISSSIPSCLPRKSDPSPLTFFQQAWREVRDAFGFKVLLHTLGTASGYLSGSQANLVRLLICQIVLGMASDPEIEEMFTTFPVASVLSSVLLEGETLLNGTEKWAAELKDLSVRLMTVCTRTTSLLKKDADAVFAAAEPSLQRVRRAAIAASTPISYDPKELLQLVHGHLLSLGLTQTAKTLTTELASSSISSPEVKASAKRFILPCRGKLAFPNKENTPRHSTNPLEVSRKNQTDSHVKRRLSIGSKEGNSSQPLKRIKLKKKVEENKAVDSTSGLVVDGSASKPNLQVNKSEEQNKESNGFTLDEIVTSWLRQQHRDCRVPVTTLQPLSLKVPHKCPLPLSKSRFPEASVNAAIRIAARQVAPVQHRQLSDRALLWSNFRFLRSFRVDAPVMTSAVLYDGGARCVVGTSTGDIQLYESGTGFLVEEYNSHRSAIVGLQVARCGSTNRDILMTVTRSQSCLWDANLLHVHSHLTLDNCQSAVMDKKAQKIGTLKLSNAGKLSMGLVNIDSGQMATSMDEIWEVGHRFMWHPFIHFNEVGDLLLSNGILWDPRTPKAIHRFDHLTDLGGGGFHPNGLEVIINSEVWDVRTRKLLRTVPSLCQTAIKFNSTGEVMFATLRKNSDEVTSVLHMRRRRNPFNSAFRTIDSQTYTELALLENERAIVDLAIDPSDSLLAVVGVDDSNGPQSMVKLWEVGRRRPLDDDSDPEAGEEDDEDIESEDDGVSGLIDRIREVVDSEDEDGQAPWERRANDSSSSMSSGSYSSPGFDSHDDDDEESLPYSPPATSDLYSPSSPSEPEYISEDSQRA